MTKTSTNNRVFVLYSNGKDAMPCTPKRARLLIERKLAHIVSYQPFTIQLHNRETGESQPIEIKFDPGADKTGIVLVLNNIVIWAAELQHRGFSIKASLDTRRNIRRGRRGRKTRYREARFLNRTRKPGWLPPSLQSRVDNCKSWMNKLTSRPPITSVSVEYCKFDTQKMQNPEISGIEYQQGELLGYEIREYLLEKFNRMCMYCDKKDVPLQVEHVLARHNGGTNRLSNLGMSCDDCNNKKNTQLVQNFVKDPIRLGKILARLQAPLRSAAIMNSTRNAIVKMFESFNLPVSKSTGAHTKMNRIAQNYPKMHWIDAACVGQTGEKVFLNPEMRFLKIKAMGRGNRQVMRTNKEGFPRNEQPKTVKRRFGFSTGDLVQVTNKYGTYISRIKSAGREKFDVFFQEKQVGTTYKHLKLLQRNDGYSYAY